MTKEVNREYMPHFYWDNVDNGMGAMQGMIKLLGRYPTEEEVGERFHLYGLVSAIRKKNGLYRDWRRFKEMMGYENNKVEANYWNNIDNGMGAMQGLIELLGRYPTYEEAEKYFRGLSAAISRKNSPYDGWEKFKGMMGYPQSGPKNNWRDVDNGMAAMAGLIEFLGGNYPTYTEVQKHIPGLYYKISKKGGPYGGWYKFKETMGYKDGKIPRGYWNDTDNGVGAMAGLIEFLGSFPNQNEVKEHLPGLYRAILKKSGPYGGWYKFKEYMGYSDGELPKGHWKDTDNGMGAMQGLIELLGRYPTMEETRIYFPGLAQFIGKKDGPYGGWYKFKETMGYNKDDEIPKGYWRDVDNGMAAMAGLIEFLGGNYPTSEKTREYLPGLLFAIFDKNGPYGGYRRFKEYMGYSDGELPKGHWKDTDNGMGAMQGLIELLGRYPTQKEILNYLSGLGSLISRRNGPYGGFSKLRLVMGYKYDGLDIGHWNDTDNGVGAMAGLIEFFGGVYPQKTEAKKYLPGLFAVLSDKNGPYGGWDKFREMMGYEDNSRFGYWKDADNGMGAMQGLIELLGRYPTYEEAQKYFSGLVNAIREKGGPYGGWYKFKETMGYLEKNPIENLISDMGGDEIPRLISLLGVNRGAMWDILAVKYGLDRKKVIELFNNEPSLGPYMGDFLTGITSVDDWDYVAERTLPFDDESGTIRKILEMSLFDSVVTRLGPRPSMEAVDEEIRNLLPKRRIGVKAIRKTARHEVG